MDNNGWNPEDDLVKCGDFIFSRSDCSIVGMYRNGQRIDKKDMTQEELLRAHDVGRKHTFEIVGENKGE